jgi:hypothetical protein
MYEVQYKNNLTDSAWSQLTSFAGNDAVQSLSDPAAHEIRYYRVQLH